MGTHQTLEEAFEETRAFGERGAICPHCGVLAGYEQVFKNSFDMGFFELHDPAAPSVLYLARCRSCRRGVLGVVKANQARLLWPTQGWPDNSPPELDEAFRADYDEARVVLPHSAKAASVLTRRCLQAVLRHKIRVKQSRLYDEIEEASSSDLLSKSTGRALHHIREIGNIGAHAKQSTPDAGDTDLALTLVNVTPKEAAYTLKVLEMLFNDLYVVPAQQAEMQAQLNLK